MVERQLALSDALHCYLAAGGTNLHETSARNAGVRMDPGRVIAPASFDAFGRVSTAGMPIEYVNMSVCDGGSYDYR